MLSRDLADKNKLKRLVGHCLPGDGTVKFTVPYTNKQWLNKNHVPLSAGLKRDCLSLGEFQGIVVY